MSKWNFPIANGGQINAFSTGAAESFKKNPMNSFGREIVQNSIDASNSDEEPVIVEFRTETTKTADIPGVNDYRRQVERCKEYFEYCNNSEQVKYADNILKNLDKEETNVLIISDYNTTGLLGVETTEPKNNNFIAFTRGSGISVKSGNNAAGSKGVGKNAGLNLSNLSMMFCETVTESGYGSYGIGSLASGYADDSKNYNNLISGVGFYKDDENNYAGGVIHELLSIGNIDNRRTAQETGTDIYIVGFNYEDWEKEVKISILNSFMYAIYRGRLVIKINEEEINQSNLKDVIDSVKNNKTTFKNIKSQYLIFSNEEGNVYSYDVETEIGDATLYVLKLDNEDCATHKCSVIRSPYMKIKDFEIQSNLSCSAVLIIERGNLLQKLRSIENPQHDDWEVNRIPDKSEKNEIRNILDSIRNQIAQHVLDCFGNQGSETLDPNGAENFLPEVQGDKSGNGSGQSNTITTPKTTITKKKKNVSSHKPGIADGENDSDKGLIPVTGGVNESEDGDTFFTPGQNKGHGANSHPGNASRQLVDGNSEVFQVKKLKTSKCNVICLDKEKGLYRITLISYEDNDDCYFKIRLLGDGESKEKVNLNITEVKCGNEILPLTNLGFGPFGIKTSQKITFEIKTTNHRNFASEVTLICK